MSAVANVTDLSVYKASRNLSLIAPPPQLSTQPTDDEKEGYTKMTHRLLETICSSSLSIRQEHVLLSVIRYTVGYQRSNCVLSRSKISEMTGIDSRHVRRALADLDEMGVISIEKTGANGSSIAFNSDVSGWKIESKYKTGGAKLASPKIDENGGGQTGPGRGGPNWPTIKDNNKEKKTHRKKCAAPIPEQPICAATAASVCDVAIATENPKTPGQESQAEDKANEVTTAKPKTRQKSKKASNQLAIQLMKLYNSNCSRLTKVSSIGCTAKREKAILDRWNDLADTFDGKGRIRYHADDVDAGLRWWSAFFKKANSIEFLAGGGGRGWVAGFDFISRQDSVIGILEGKYSQK